MAFCPRSDIPLVYKAQNSWFVDIQNVKQNLLDKNEEINWYPEHLKHGRFAKSIESAPDWCISRTRYWGTPMPIYRQKDAEGFYTKDETLVIGSREELFELNKSYAQLTKVLLVNPNSEKYNTRQLANQFAETHIDAVYADSEDDATRVMLEKLLENKGTEIEVSSDHKELIKKHAGQTILLCTSEELYKNGPNSVIAKIAYVFADTAVELDLHRPYIDSVRVLSPNTGKELFRIPEVLDVWFDSGSMPYAQLHYPFENKESMEASFPADYIVEYTGQIRAWFYIMHVIGVLIFDKPAYTNVLCT